MNSTRSACFCLLVGMLLATSLHAQDVFTNNNGASPKPIFSEDSQSLFVPISPETSNTDSSFTESVPSTAIENSTPSPSVTPYPSTPPAKKEVTESTFKNSGNNKSIENSELSHQTTQSIEGSYPESPSPVIPKNKIKKPVTTIEGSRPSSKTLIKKLFNNQFKQIDYNNQSYYIYSHKHLKSAYHYFGYSPMWMKDDRLSDNALELIKEIRKAKYHALPPKIYHYDLFKSLNKNSVIDEPEILDILLMDAFATYKDHLSNGILNPRDYFPEWNTRKQDLDLVLDLVNIQKGESIEDNLDKVNNRDYFILVKEYKKRLSEKQITEEYPKVPNIKMTLGDAGKSVKILRERLGLSIDSDVYDDELLGAVKLFQTANNLTADGIVGQRTIREINRDPINYLKALTASLERMRWGKKIKKNSTYVWINIPNYKMSVRQGKKTLFETTTIVGRPSRPTPVFEDTLEFVVLAPYWNVPKTIFQEDKLPKLQRNPNALGSEIQVISLNTGKTVSPRSVNWKNGGKGYRLRQKPGPKNALGLMKFLFPNRHAIYMHDTPGRHLFSRRNKAISSGCIRLKDAKDFAYFLLKHHNYSKDKIKLNSKGKREKWVKLDKSLNYPVYLNYFTAWVDQNGQVNYSDDIYSHDKRLNNEYQQTLSGI